MKVRIYQINEDRDENKVVFCSYHELCEKQDDTIVYSTLYDMKWEGELPFDDLEEVYQAFNHDQEILDHFEGRILSVSDVVEVLESEKHSVGFYYCDSIGFKLVQFCAENEKTVDKTIRVIYIAPGKEAKVMELKTDLASLQEAVGGYIETYYPFDGDAMIVCNDEGKLNGMSPNRGIYDDDGKLMDIIFGPFFICNGSEEEFGSLSDEDVEKYLNQFRNPEVLSKSSGQFCMIKMTPDMYRVCV